jgi:hypothetical protein
MGHGLAARAELKHWNNLGERIDREREPENLVGAAQPGAQFIQLQMREPEDAERTLVQRLSVLASAGQPGSDSRLSVAEDSLGSGWVQPFGKGREHHSDLVRRGFQAVEGGVTPRTEGGVASLAAKGLDLLGTAMLAISDEGVDLSSGDAEVGARSVGTGEAVGVHALGCSPTAFDLAPGTHRQRRWLSTRRGYGGESTGGAIVWSAGLQQTEERAALGPSS